MLQGCGLCARDKGDHIVTTGRTPGYNRAVPVPRTLGYRITILPVDGQVGSIPMISAGDHAEHDPCQHHAREQRGGHPSTDRGVARDCPRARYSVSHRRCSVRRQVADRRRCARRRSAVDCRPQDVCAQGGRRPVRAPRHIARTTDSRCRPRRWPARRHGERPACGRLGKACELALRPYADGSGADVARPVLEALQTNSAIGWSSMAIRRIASRTRSMFHSSAGSAPTYWNGWMAWRLRPDRRVTPVDRAVAGAGGDGRHTRCGHGRRPLQPRAQDDARRNRRSGRTSNRSTCHHRMTIRAGTYGFTSAATRPKPSSSQCERPATLRCRRRRCCCLQSRSNPRRCVSSSGRQRGALSANSSDLQSRSQRTLLAHLIRLTERPALCVNH